LQNGMTYENRVFIILSLTVLFFLFSYPIPAQEFEFLNEMELEENILMPEELLYRMKSGSSDFVIYDIRKKDAFLEVHIRGAENYSWVGGDFIMGFSDFPRDRDIFLVSEDGVTAFDALRFLLGKGFIRVYVMEGGMENWLYRDFLVR
jgi:rhodanese-related sulfurtransferase